MKKSFEPLDKCRRTFDELLRKFKDVGKVQDNTFTSKHNYGRSDNTNQNSNGASASSGGDSTNCTNRNDLDKAIESILTDKFLH